MSTKKDNYSLKDKDYIAWIGHATFLIKMGNNVIITDPVFSKNAGPLVFGPKRFTQPALNLNEIPKTDIFLLTHNHYDHLDVSTVRKFPYKKTKVLAPLKLGKYFRRYNDVNEMFDVNAIVQSLLQPIPEREPVQTHEQFVEQRDQAPAKKATKRKRK